VSKTIKVLLADDHGIVRKAIGNLLLTVTDIEVIGEAKDGETAVQMSLKLAPNVVLMDVMMPGIGGLEATRRILQRNPEIKVIALTACDEEPFPSKLLEAGASGYLVKDCELEEMVQAIHKVHAGTRYISPRIAQHLALKSINKSSGDVSPLDQLSARELQIMMMITNGQTVKEIANKLCLSPKTVNSYRYRLFDKLKIKSDVELTHLAMRYKMLEKDSISTSS
jgi:two-component system invasion response regulator UvrY